MGKERLGQEHHMLCSTTSNHTLAWKLSASSRVSVRARTSTQDPCIMLKVLLMSPRQQRVLKWKQARTSIGVPCIMSKALLQSAGELKMAVVLPKFLENLIAWRGRRARRNGEVKGEGRGRDKAGFMMRLC